MESAQMSGSHGVEECRESTSQQRSNTAEWRKRSAFLACSESRWRIRQDLVDSRLSEPLSSKSSLGYWRSKSRRSILHQSATPPKESSDSCHPHDCPRPLRCLRDDFWNLSRKWLITHLFRVARANPTADSAFTAHSLAFTCLEAKV